MQGETYEYDRTLDLGWRAVLEQVGPDDLSQCIKRGYFPAWHLNLFEGVNCWEPPFSLPIHSLIYVHTLTVAFPGLAPSPDMRDALWVRWMDLLAGVLDEQQIQVRLYSMYSWSHASQSRSDQVVRWCLLVVGNESSSAKLSTFD